MRKLSTFVDCLLITAVAVAAPTANEDFVVAEDAKTYTNAVNAANAYTDGKIAEIPVPDNYASATMPGRLRMSLPEDSEFVEPLAVFDYYVFMFDDSLGKPRVVFQNGVFHMECEYGSAVGERDDFDGIVTFNLPNAPFERYVFSYTMSPVATLGKIEMTSAELNADISTLRDSIPSTTSNIVTKAYVEGLGISLQESDPTVPQWAKAQTKPTYTASEVGAYSTGDVDSILRDYLSLDYFKDGQTIPMYWGDGTKLCDFGANWLGNLENTVNDKTDADEVGDIASATVSNIVTAAYINDRVNVTPLAGRTYNFATNIGLYTAVRDIIQALGGSVTNFPAIPQN